MLACWHDLDSERSAGFSAAGPIPWTAIMEWAGAHGADRDQARVIAEAIRVLDVDRAERITSEQKQREKKKGRK